MSTIRDVARAAGVSIATVSRVFNGSPRVSQETGRRVSEAAARLGYWPNCAAQSLSSRRTNCLGVLLPDLHGEFFSEVIRGIDAAARRNRCQLLFSSSHAHADEVVAAARSMRGRIDGLIVMASDEGSVEKIPEIARRFPVVALNPFGSTRGCHVIAVDNFEGAYAAVAHLVKLGHRRIGMITGPEVNGDARERRRGYRKALRDAGLVDGEDGAAALETAGDFTESSGYRAASVIARQSPRPTAVFAANDYMAVGLMSALHGMGLRVPEDMAVIGFDDITIARYLSPPLTTVQVDAYELGERAVELLISVKKSPRAVPRARNVMHAALVVRRSCGSPPVPHELGPALEAVGVHTEDTRITRTHRRRHQQ